LCDTGASYSVFPFRSTELPLGPSLTGLESQQILCWGERELTLSFHGASFTWIFLLANVQFPILGIDFLRHYHLVVDAAGTQVVDARSMRAFPAASTVSQWTGRRGVFSCIGGTPPPFRQLLVDYQDVLNPSGKLPPTTHMPMSGRPVTARFRRLDLAMQAAAKAAFEEMEWQGMVQLLSVPPAHGEKGGWVLAPLRQFPAVEPDNGAGQVPAALYGQFGGQPQRVQNLQQAGLETGVPSDTDAGGGY
jgi:hypothetical protein